jgi:hypothetical protein
MLVAQDDIERRLDNWVLWRGGNTRSGLGFPSSSPITRIGMVSERYASDRIPYMAGEAFDTDCAIGMLKPEYRAAIEWHWLRAPLARNGELAKLLGCCRNTVATRLQAAKHALADMLAAQRIARQRSARTHVAASVGRT